jgi:hypothetical protein
MDGLTFVSSLISSLAWPVAVVVLVLAFRKPIGRMFERLPKRVKAGPVEVEWPEVATEARVALATSSEVRTDASPGSLTERFAKLAEEEPAAAIMAAWAEVEKSLRARVGDLAVRQRSLAGLMLARLAREQGTISDSTLRAVEGLSVLRNLAAHGRDGEVDREKALDYLTLADATLFAIRTRRLTAGS